MQENVQNAQSLQKPLNRYKPSNMSDFMQITRLHLPAIPKLQQWNAKNRAQ
jgi:hypothetical protein